MSQLESLEFQGCRLAYRIDGSGPPLVMIQGVGAYGTVVNPQIELLSKHYTCLSFDNRGIGASQPSGRKLSAEQMSNDVTALIDHQHWDSAHLVGHSFGGLIAMQFAASHKRRVRSLSLLCSFARGADISWLSLNMMRILLRLRFGSRQVRRFAFMELVVPRGHPDLESPALAGRLSAIVGHDIADMPRITGQQLRAMRKADVSPKLGELAGIPSLVINGEHDRIARPELGRAVAAGIPHARYIEIPRAAHAFPVLDPQRCAELLLEHLSVAEDALRRP